MNAAAATATTGSAGSRKRWLPQDTTAIAVTPATTATSGASGVRRRTSSTVPGTATAIVAMA